MTTENTITATFDHETGTYNLEGRFPDTDAEWLQRIMAERAEAEIQTLTATRPEVRIGHDFPDDYAPDFRRELQARWVDTTYDRQADIYRRERMREYERQARYYPREEMVRYATEDISWFDSLRDEFMVKKQKERNMRSITNFKPEQIMELKTHEPTEVERKNISFNILQIGAGGTGGYVVPYLARFLYMAQIRDQDLTVNYSIADADIVEEKNILRQNFIPSDVGSPKAEVLARRYSRAFGIEIDTYEEMMDESTLDRIINNMSSKRPRNCNVNIILGCVDNNEARRHFHKWIKGKRGRNNQAYYWIDSGNEKTDGQVIVGATSDHSNLPNVTEIYPDILDARHDPRETVSCDDRLMEDEQTMFVNAQAAIYMLNFCRKILLQEKLTVHGIDFDISCKATPRFLLEGEHELPEEIVMASDVVAEPVEQVTSNSDAVEVLGNLLNGGPMTSRVVGELTSETDNLANLDLNTTYNFIGTFDQINIDETQNGDGWIDEEGYLVINVDGEHRIMGLMNTEEVEVLDETNPDFYRQAEPVYAHGQIEPVGYVQAGDMQFERLA